MRWTNIPYLLGRCVAPCDLRPAPTLLLPAAADHRLSAVVKTSRHP